MSNIRKLNMLPGNVKIKIEPGTSRFGNMIHDNISIKIEPGTSERLASLKLPRDLKLGGSRAKVFKPNLNVVRNKKNDVIHPQMNNVSRGRGRGRGGDRGRGAPRGRHSQNTVQSYGVFSEGIADNMMKRNSQNIDRDDRMNDNSRVMDKPTFNKNIEWKVDKEHEEAILKDLLHSDVNPDEMETENDLQPVKLPVTTISEQKPVIKLENYIKTEDGPKDKILTEKNIFETQEKLILFQFPDTLPGIGSAAETDQSKINATANHANTDTTPELEKAETENKCNLQNINEGLLGKILIYKSGKSKISIGSSWFDMQIGPDSGFLQDVMSVPLNRDTHTGDMINLGTLQGSIIVTPEWDHLLKCE